MASPPFGVIPVGQAFITTPSSAPSETSFLYSIGKCESIVVCLIPGTTLPAQTAAAVYATSATDFASTSAAGQAPNFTFLGGIGPGQESAMFDVVSYATGADGIVVGISVEAADVVAAKIQQLPPPPAKSTTTNREATISLAQAIISNAFDFIASFSGSVGPGGVEVVPLKAFENWWKKFESRVRSDPSFLEKK
ncbi:hypothetical protein TD95_003023 [Thielaviopsis punctulata]|uniref:Uncharacterized protein n=1 Tax=Thielaviopsis punctulata TaxID=72032 RepID=A0A0F4ZDY4_9PEZI|nr:hypothetical protein TD95_003023 [Thielaviopsis punctulata]